MDLRSEISNVLPCPCKKYKNQLEEEIKFTNENTDPGISFYQKDRDTDLIYLSYSSPKTQSRTYLYNLKSKERKLVKEQEIPSGHNPEDYIVERLECNHMMEGKYQFNWHKKTKVDGTANTILYGYGSYGSSMSPSFSSSKFSLIDIHNWVTAHIRGGMERGMKWWKKVNY